jgi:hypothetical protein
MDTGTRTHRAPAVSHNNRHLNSQTVFKQCLWQDWAGGADWHPRPRVEDGEEGGRGDWLASCLHRINAGIVVSTTNLRNLARHVTLVESA